jgi:hypothetical protein
MSAAAASKLMVGGSPSRIRPPAAPKNGAAAKYAPARACAELAHREDEEDEARPVAHRAEGKTEGDHAR